MQQQPPAMSPFVSFPGPNLCMATTPGCLVPSEIYGGTEDAGKLCYVRGNRFWTWNWGSGDADVQ